MAKSRPKTSMIRTDPLTDLITSAKSGDPEVIRYKARELGADLNFEYPGGMTLLTKAIEGNEALSTVDAIIKTGAGVDVQNRQGETALVIAIRVRRPDLIEILIESGANPNLTRYRNSSALSLCLQERNFSYLEMLLKNLNKAYSICETINEICVLIIRRNKKLQATCKSDFGLTHLIVENELMSAIKNVFNVNDSDETGTTPLMYAVECHYDDCVRFLLLAGADVNRVNKKRETALKLAMKRAANPILKNLIRAGAFIKHPRSKTSSMHFEMFKKILDYLQENKLFNMQDIYGKTALMYAAERGDRNCIMYAIEMDIEEFAKVEFQHNKKRKRAARYVKGCDEAGLVSPLFKCKGHDDGCCEDCDQYFVEQRGNYKDKKGKPLLLYAFETGQKLLDSYIQLRASDDAGYRDENGRTILMNYFKFYQQNPLGDKTRVILSRAKRKTGNSESTLMHAFKITYKAIDVLFGGNVNIRDHDGNSTVIYAIEYYEFLTEEITLFVGDTQKEQYKDGKTALMIALIHDELSSVSCIQPLIGDSCNIKDTCGKTALMYAMINRRDMPHNLIVQMIGDSQNLQDNDGKTALMYAMINRRDMSDNSIIQMIGDSQNLQDIDGKTALMHAMINRRGMSDNSIIQMIGDSQNLQDIDGKTALMHAMINRWDMSDNLIIQMIGDSQNLQDNDGKTALMYAFIHNVQLSEEMVERLAGENTFIQDKYGKTALMYALEFNQCLNYGIIKYLFAGKVSIRDNKGNTTVLYAVKYNQFITEEVIALLVGDTQKEQYEEGKTALMIALQLFNANIEKYMFTQNPHNFLYENENTTFMDVIRNLPDHLSKEGIQIHYSNYLTGNYLKPLIGDTCNIQDKHGKTALMYALMNTRGLSDNIIKQMIDDSQNIQDQYGKTMLMHAFIHNVKLSEEIIENLAGENPFIQDKYGKTALMYAFEFNRRLEYKTINELFRGKVNIRDNEGNTTVIYALKYYTYINKEIITLLVGDTQNTQYKDGKTALMIALQIGKLWNGTHAFMEPLLANACTVQDDEGKTALMHAIKLKRHLPDHVIKQMIRDSQYVQDKEGKTALMHDSQSSNFSHTFITHLFNRDVLNVQDIFGKTALHHAIEHSKNYEYLNHLIVHGANLEIEDNKGRTALILCLEHDTREDVSPYGGRGTFLKTKMLLQFNPIPRLNPKGKILLFSSVEKEIFSSMNVLENKEIFRLMIASGVVPFPNTRSKFSTLFGVLKHNLIDVSKYVIANLCLTNGDLKMLNNAKKWLKSNKNARNPHIAFELNNLDLSSPDLQKLVIDTTSQPWPLFKLSLIAVNSAVGHGTNREKRIEMLPLPNTTKDMLMFNTRTALLPVSEWANIPMVFDPVKK